MKILFVKLQKFCPLFENIVIILVPFALSSLAFDTVKLDLL